MRFLLSGALALCLIPACGGGRAPDPRSGEPAAATSPSPRPAMSPEVGGLLGSLRSGGYVIYFRHAATVPGGDSDPQNLANCAAQRNLSERGREQARQIGEAFRQLQIPVGRVVSSAFCRTLDTANLAFGRAEQSLDLTSLPQAGSEVEEERRVQALRELLAAPPPPGENTVLVAHLFNIQRAAGTNLAEGEAAIFQPRGGGRFELVATVAPEEWPALEGRANPSVRTGPTA